MNTYVIAVVIGCFNVYAGWLLHATTTARRPFYGSKVPEPTFSLTPLGEAALASRDSPQVMCGCGNCDGDLGPSVLAMHGQIMGALYDSPAKPDTRGQLDA